MDSDQDRARRLVALEARMDRMERLMQNLLSTLTTSGAERDRLAQMQNMLQELQYGREDLHAATGNPPGMTAQERPEIAAIRQALLAGDKIKAIQLYRSAYGVGLKEAQEAIKSMHF